MKRLNWIFALPFLIAAVLFVISNRQMVDMGLWPLPFEISLPLAAVGGIFFVVGFVLGGVVVWLGGHTVRSRSRKQDKTIRDQGRQIASLEQARKDVEKQLDVRA